MLSAAKMAYINILVKTVAMADIGFAGKKAFDQSIPLKRQLVKWLSGIIACLFAVSNR